MVEAMNVLALVMTAPAIAAMLMVIIIMEIIAIVVAVVERAWRSTER